MRDAARRVPAGGLVLAAICIVLLIDSADASSVLVPGDYPTIQQAIDSGADTVVVKEGRYEEDLEIVGGRVTLLTEERPHYAPQFAQVIVGGLDAIADVIVEGFRFTGPVKLQDGPPRPSPYVRLEGCRFDSSFDIPLSFVFLWVRGCTFYEDVTVRPYSFEFVNSTFIGAHVECGFEGDGRFIGNAFVGPGEFAIKVNYHDGGLTIAGNFITGKVDGITARHVKWARVENNEISDCAGGAVRVESDGSPIGGPSGLLDCVGNRVKNCGGHAFDCTNVLPNFVGNVIDSIGGDGIRMTGSVARWIRDNEVRHTGGRGIAADHVAAGLSGNTVIGTGGDGIVANYAARADSNVVGRAQGKGIWLETSGDSRTRRNTVYACAGDGIRLESSSPVPDSLTANIAYANGGAGLVVAGPGTAVLTCNDWQANSGGATVGIAPGPTDLAVDPLFCNVVENDVSLTSASPLLNAPGCGQIGALGQGCEISISGPLGVSPAPERFRVFPQPALDRVTFSWPAGAPVRLEVFDVTGARRWQADAAAGTGEMSWGLSGIDGARLPAGVYWARLTRNGEALHSRIVRIR